MSVRSETYPLSRHLVAQALQRAIERSGLAFRPDDRNPNILFADTGLSLRSYGERITIRITAQQHQTEVQVESKTRWLQLIDWGKSQENVDRFFQHLHNCLPPGQRRPTDEGQQSCVVCGTCIISHARYCPNCGVQQSSANNTENTAEAQEETSNSYSHTDLDSLGPDFTILSVSPQCTDDELKSAYRTKISEWHPDRLNNMAPELRQIANDRCAEINAAFERIQRMRTAAEQSKAASSPTAGPTPPHTSRPVEGNTRNVTSDASVHTSIKAQRPPLPLIVQLYALLCLAFGLYFLNNSHDYWNYSPYGMGTDTAHQLLAATQLLFAAITLCTALMIVCRAKNAWGGVWAVTCIALDWVCNDTILCAAYGGALTDCPGFSYVLFGTSIVIVQLVFATWFTVYWKRIQAPLSAIKIRRVVGTLVLLAVLTGLAYVASRPQGMPSAVHSAAVTPTNLANAAPGQQPAVASQTVPAADGTTVTGAWDIASAMKMVYGTYDPASRTAFWSDPNPPVDKHFDFHSEHGGTVQLVLDAPFVDGALASQKYFVVTATSPTGEDFSCHACRPLLGAFVFTHSEFGWVIESQERFLLQSGGWGRAPTTDLVRRADGRYGVKFTDTYTNQGETSTSWFIAEPVGSRIVMSKQQRPQEEQQATSSQPASVASEQHQPASSQSANVASEQQQTIGSVASQPTTPDWSTEPAEPNPKPPTRMQRGGISSSSGTWTDPATGLMWTTIDNGRDVNWDEATNYCKNMSLGGYSAWRLPSIDELRSIYRGIYIHYPGSISQFDYKKLSVPFHVKGGIGLTGLQWSATQDDSNGFRAAYVLFLDGTRGASLLNGSQTLRALCVRRSDELGQ